MKIVVRSGDLRTAKTEVLLCGVFEHQKLRGLLQDADQALKGSITDVFRSGHFEGKNLQIVALHTQRSLPFKWLVLVGLGKPEDRSMERIRQAIGKACTRIREMGVREFVTSTQMMGQGQEPVADLAQGMVEGALLSLYRFTKYRTKEEKNPKEIGQFTMIEKTPDLRAIRAGVALGETTARAVCFSRDLINYPANEMTPTLMAKAAQKIAREHQVRCRIFSKTEIERLGMGAFLGVAQGSAEPLKLIVLEYFGGRKGDPPVVLVGKSITFDSGGISIKPSEGMEKMKYDMSGGAATLGVIQAVSEMKLPVNVVGILPATENLPSGTAVKPGDILRSMGGWTIEVVNTDAEGRLVLADALTYGLRYRPAAIIDMATLTGACVVALGNHAIGMVGNNRNLVQRIVQAGEKTWERVWEMPLWEEYHEQIKSPVADIKNTGGRDAGMITASAFLSKFVEGYPWVHLDIAGVAWKDTDAAYIPKGGAGVGVRLLIQFLRDWAGERPNLSNAPSIKKGPRA